MCVLTWCKGELCVDKRLHRRQYNCTGFIMARLVPYFLVPLANEVKCGILGMVFASIRQRHLNLYQPRDCILSSLGRAYFKTVIRNQVANQRERRRQASKHDNQPMPNLDFPNLRSTYCFYTPIDKCLLPKNAIGDSSVGKFYMNRARALFPTNFISCQQGGVYSKSG